MEELRTQQHGEEISPTSGDKVTVEAVASRGDSRAWECGVQLIISGDERVRLYFPLVEADALIKALIGARNAAPGLGELR